MQTTSVMGAKNKASMAYSGPAHAVLTTTSAQCATWLTSMIPHIPSSDWIMLTALGKELM